MADKKRSLLETMRRCSAALTVLAERLHTHNAAGAGCRLLMVWGFLCCGPAQHAACAYCMDGIRPNNKMIKKGNRITKGFIFLLRPTGEVRKSMVEGYFENADKINQPATKTKFFFNTHAECNKNQFSKTGRRYKLINL